MNSQTFSRFIMGRFLSQLAARIGDFAFPLAIYLQSSSLALSGIAIAVEWLARVIGLPICGSLTDRFKGGALLTFADALRAILAIIPFFFWDVYILLAVSAVFGFFAALSQVTLERVVAASGRPLQRTQMSLEALNGLAFILGSAAAAMLVGFLPLRSLFVVLPILFFIAMPFSLGVGDVGRPSGLSLSSDVFLACSILASTPRLRQIVLCGFLLSMAVGIITATGPAMVNEEFALPNTAFAQVQMWAALATFLAILGNRYIPGAGPRIHWLGLGGLGPELILLVTAPGIQFWTLGYGIFYAGIVLFSIYLRCERIAHIPSEHYGKALGIIMVLTAAGIPIGGTLVACFAKLMPVRNVSAMALPIFAAALLTFGLLKKGAVRRSERRV